jgi:hypothetical protein
MAQTAKLSAATNLVVDIARAHAVLAGIPKVYSFYLAYRAQKGLVGPDPENIIASVGPIETIGDCKHAIEVGDTTGTRYRITVEVI